jgi:hypothetical protein
VTEEASLISDRPPPLVLSKDRNGAYADSRIGREIVDTGGIGASNPRAGRSSAGERGEWDNWALVSHPREPVAPDPAFRSFFPASPVSQHAQPYILGIQGSGVDLSLPRHG